jgi:hypothetical protein
MERGKSSMMQQMVGTMAPAAGLPGRGTGNIPYAKGMQTGQFGPQPGAAPSPPAGAAPGAPSPPAPPTQSRGGPPSSSGAPPIPQGPGQSNPFMNPMFYFDVMGSIMSALVSASESDVGVY